MTLPTPDPLTDLERTAAEVARLAEAATTGPWHHRLGGLSDVVVDRPEGPVSVCLMPGWPRRGMSERADGAFIAHARTSAPALAAAIPALVAVARAAEDYCAVWTGRLASEEEMDRMDAALLRMRCALAALRRGEGRGC